jgi:glycine betaine/proline transport system substrate-binding protein
MKLHWWITPLIILMLAVAGCTAMPAAPAADQADTAAATDAPAEEADAADTEAADTETAASEGDVPMAEGEIQMARATWDTGFFQAAVFETLLSELGYDVELIGDLPAETFYPALAQGDVDLWANGWFPLHQTFLESDVVAGQVEPVGYQVRAGALQGFLVDKATADEYGITSITDFEDPEIAALFDTDGDGLADLTGCDAGWGCEGAINTILAEQELEDNITHVQGTYSLLMADTIARYQRGEPIFFYTWTPNWTVAELALGEDVVWITVPGAETTPDVPGCVENPCAMGFVGNDIRAVANTEFLENNPAAHTLLEQVEIPLEDIAAENTLLLEGEDSAEDIERHAAEWIEENSDLVEGWLETARAEIS